MNIKTSNVLVVGAKGQLSNNIEDISKDYPKLNMFYKDYLEADITNLVQLEAVFKSQAFSYCINCAAYTAVDKAESESQLACKINEKGSENLAILCDKYSVILIHISTDFVFDGQTSVAYKEKDITNPLGVYGHSKLNGEKAIQKKLKNHFIIRTSWLYSEHNTNFMKTMIKLGKIKEEIKVVDDQIGTPTYAKDLGKVIFEIIIQKSEKFGLYNYSNEGVASWYDFAQAIFQETRSEIKLLPTKTKDYPTAAERPIFSVLDKTKIKQTFKIEIPHWRSSLKEALQNFSAL